jgi:hypothetical protein
MFLSGDNNLKFHFYQKKEGQKENMEIYLGHPGSFETETFKIKIEKFLTALRKKIGAPTNVGGVTNPTGSDNIIL